VATPWQPYYGDDYGNPFLYGGRGW
jgi:hypothetical protein